MADIGTWYNSLPRFTRLWLTGTVGLSLLARFNLLPYETVYLSSQLVFGRLQLWRCITSLLVYPLSSSKGFHFLVNCYFIVQYSGRLEREQYGKTPSAYLYLLIIAAALANVGGMLFNVYFLMDLLVVAITYVWCQLNKEVIVSFWFGTRFKAIYLPWVLAGMELVFDGSFASLVGIFIGHAYYFLKFQYPQELGGPAVLETPQFLVNLVPDISGGFGGFGVPPASRAPPRPAAQSSWGTGNVLGR